MNTKLDNGDIITTETIADKIRRIAKHPSVVRNRRLLKAMSHIANREDADMKFTNVNLSINGGSRNVVGVVAHIAVNNGVWKETMDDKIIMFPLNSFDPHTGEPPTLRE